MTETQPAPGHEERRTEPHEKHRPAGMPTIKLFVVVLVAVFVGTYAANVLSFGLAGSTGKVVAGSGSAAAPAAGPSPAAPPAGGSATINLASAESFGDPNAPVTIVEYSDLQCPFCGRFFSETLGQLKTEYVDTGKVRFFYKHFPLSFHPFAEKSAEAVECAGDQGKFWELHDKIFSDQNSLSLESLKVWAAELGLDAAKFNACLDSGEKATTVQADFNEGNQDGVSGTPTFFINGQKLVGAQPYSAFKSLIDAQLA